ncbi:DUF4292 domain-containing protein [Myxococcota bacterium]|nr:DUF4292 domain-containing protein [Myxococcota bacterium]
MRRALLLLSATLAACSGGQPRPDDFQADPAAHLQRLDARAAQIRSLTADLAVEYKEDGERVRLTEMIALKAPDHLRVDLISPFGQPLLTLVSDGQTLSIYDQRARRFYRGRSSPQALGKLLPLRLTPEELVALMRGGVPIISHARGEVTWDGAAGRTLLRLEGAEGCALGACQTIAFEPERHRVTALHVTQAGQARYSARMGDYQGGDALPRRMRFEGEGIVVDVEIKEARINPTLPDAAFALEPPRGITVEPLE